MKSIYFLLMILNLLALVPHVVQAQKFDSLITNQIKNTGEIKVLRNKIEDQGIADSLKILNSETSIKNNIEGLKSIKGDSVRRKEVEDSLKTVASKKLKAEALKEAGKIKEIKQASEVAGYLKSLKKDSLNLDQVAEEQLKKTNYGKELEKLEGQEPLKNMKSQTDKSNEQAKSLQDKEQLERYSAEKASKLGRADLAKYAPQIQTAQNEFIKYKKKAEWLKEGSEPNANSLKETPTKKRFTYGGNIQIPSLSPFTIVAAPYIGYQLNKKITSGVSVTYKFNLDNNKIFKANNVGTEYGYRIFTDYKLIKSWFAHAEFEQLNKLTKSKDSDAVHTKLQTNGYIGAGRQIEVYKGWKLNATFLVNLLHKDLMYLNPNAFQFRVGVSK